jgi:hypothetical protein
LKFEKRFSSVEEVCSEEKVLCRMTYIVAVEVVNGTLAKHGHLWFFHVRDLLVDFKD